MERSTETLPRVHMPTYLLSVLSFTALISGASANTKTDFSFQRNRINLFTLDNRIPIVLEPPVPTQLINVYFGSGFQEYVFNGTQWILFNVSASLFDVDFNKIAHHMFITIPGENATYYPNWASDNPKSSVTAKTISVVPQDSAIPLVLLQVIEVSGDKEYFGRAAYVQRLETRLGLPPTPISLITASKGDMFKSDYSALYAFYELVDK